MLIGCPWVKDINFRSKWDHRTTTTVLQLTFVFLMKIKLPEGHSNKSIQAQRQMEQMQVITSPGLFLNLPALACLLFNYTFFQNQMQFANGHTAVCAE